MKSVSSFSSIDDKIRFDYKKVIIQFHLPDEIKGLFI